ncbi:MAG: hypothetical protein V9E89_03590 [Ilumatobacteraceae bacterium]
MQSLALLFLFRGLRTRRAVGWLIAAGLFAGGALYTYNSSRLFPVWLGIALLALLLSVRFDRRTLWRVMLFGAVMTVTAAPMLVYAFQRPDVFFGRLSEVTQAEQSITLGESILLHGQMFFLRGDPYYRYNIPGQPYFSLPEGFLLMAGLAAAALALIRRVDPVVRAGLLLILLSPLMVIPSVISVGGLPPSHMRSLGMVPLIFLAPALGLERVLDWSGRRWPAIPWRRYAPVAFVAVLVVGSALVGIHYFEWAARNDVFLETDADLSAAARWAVEHVQPGERLYIAARDKGHPTVMIEPLPEIAWLGTDSFFLPPAGQSGLYLFPRSAPPQPEWLPLLEPGRIDGLPLAPDGQPAFFAFRLAGEAPDLSADAPANTYLRFVELNAPAIPAGESVWLTTAWQVIQPPDVGDFTPLIQIEDQHGTVYARSDAYMAGTDLWRAGETLFQQVHVDIPPFTAPGEYRVRAAWVGRAADRYAPYLNADGSQAGIWADIGSLHVDRTAAFPSPQAVAVEHAVMQDLGPVRLLGFDGTLDERRPGRQSAPDAVLAERYLPPVFPLELRVLLRPLDGSERAGAVGRATGRRPLFDRPVGGWRDRCRPRALADSSWRCRPAMPQSC